LIVMNDRDEDGRAEHRADNDECLPAEVHNPTVGLRPAPVERELRSGKWGQGSPLPATCSVEAMPRFRS
jgi:hypothetical protein